MRQYAQEIGDRFVAALAHSYGDAYTFLRSRSNVARWSPEHVVVLRDCVEHAYQARRISAETMEKACQLIASLVGDYDDPKTDEIAPRPTTIGKIRGLTPASNQGSTRGSTQVAIAEVSRPASPSSVAVAVRSPVLTVNAVARDPAPETVLLSEVASSSQPSTAVARPAPSPALVTATPYRIVAGATLAQRYVLEKLIGIGGTSLIYQARDLKAVGSRAEQRVAVKILHPALQLRPQAVERFTHQFRQQQKLSHAGIARVFDLDEDAGSWFMTMELLKGENLLDRLRRGLSRSDALRLIATCGDALEYAHQCGVVHGDLKPSNVFLTASGELRLLDFGGTVEPRSMGAAAGDAGVAATPAYASPEVLAGEPAAVRDDVFSLACIAHELLTGQHRQVLDGVPAPARTPSGALSLRDSLALSRGMAWQRMDRPGTVPEFLRLLLAPQSMVNLPALVSSSHETAAATQRTRWQRHGRVLGFGLWGVGCLVALLSFAFGDPQPLRQAVGPTSTAVAEPRAEPAAKMAPAEAAPSAVTPSAGVPVPTAPLSAVPDAPPPASTWVPSEPAVTPALPKPKPSPSPPVTARRVAAARVLPVAASAANAVGSIGLERRQVLVSGRAVAAVITLRRIGGTSGRARVRWSTEPGTAKSVEHFRSASAIAEFADGQEIRTLFVPIMQQPSDRSARTFSVALERAPGGPPVGPVTRTTVTILGDT